MAIWSWEAYKKGEKDAKEIIAKKKPKSLMDHGSIAKTLEKRVEKKYPEQPQYWKNLYLGGVEGELSNHFYKVRKK